MSAEHYTHQPVLLEEVLHYLAVKPTGIYIDATFGRGGHSRKICQQLKPPGQLIALDKDPDAALAAHSMVSETFKFVPGSYASIAAVAQQHYCLNQVNGILIDCGVSSPQLDDAERGFSFLKDGPLDMRMDSTSTPSAAEWLSRTDEKQLIFVLKHYGEERYARRIARAIMQAQIEKPIETTLRLADIVAKAHPNWEAHKHPATRTFQAIRIEINHELDELSDCLKASLNCLAPGGRLLVISFHSLEDGLVKRFIRQAVSGDEVPKEVPLTVDELNPTLRWVLKRTNPHPKEIATNPRARSAVLRVAEKI